MLASHALAWSGLVPTARPPDPVVPSSRAANPLAHPCSAPTAEGLARLVGASESPSDATPLLHALIRIPCQRLDQLLNQGRPPPTAAAAPPPVVDAPMAAAVALQLRMLAAAIRYCDSFPTLSGTQHPVLGVLQLCWPLLQETAVRGTPEVLLSLYDVYGRAMTCLRMQLAPLLPQLLAQLGSTFSRTPVVGCLACVTEVRAAPPPTPHPQDYSDARPAPPHFATLHHHSRAPTGLARPHTRHPFTICTSLHPQTPPAAPARPPCGADIRSSCIGPDGWTWSTNPDAPPQLASDNTQPTKPTPRGSV